MVATTPAGIVRVTVGAERYHPLLDGVPATDAVTPPPVLVAGGRVAVRKSNPLELVMPTLPLASTAWTKNSTIGLAVGPLPTHVSPARLVRSTDCHVALLPSL